jgi:hypothetical protein
MGLREWFIEEPGHAQRGLRFLLVGTCLTLLTWVVFHIVISSYGSTAGLAAERYLLLWAFAVHLIVVGGSIHCATGEPEWPHVFVPGCASIVSLLVMIDSFVHLPLEVTTDTGVSVALVETFCAIAFAYNITVVVLMVVANAMREEKDKVEKAASRIGAPIRHSRLK